MNAHTRPRRPIVVQPFRERLGLAQPLQSQPDLTELGQHGPELEADLEGLVERGRAVRQRGEDAERLFEPGPGVPECRARGRFESGLPEVVHRLLSQLSPTGVMREPLDVLTEAIRVERLDRLDDPRMKLMAALLQQPAVRDVLGERVREGVLRARIEPGLVEELGRAQVVESATERLVRQVGNRLEQRERDVLADDGGGLQEMFVLREQPVELPGLASCSIRPARWVVWPTAV